MCKTNSQQSDEISKARLIRNSHKENIATEMQKELALVSSSALREYFSKVNINVVQVDNIEERSKKIVKNLNESLKTTKRRLKKIVADSSFQIQARMYTFQ